MRSNPTSYCKDNSVELRLFLEELVCDACRLVHLAVDGVPPGRIRILLEKELAEPGCFADILIEAEDLRYFVEVKYGYTDEQIIKSIARKFQTTIPFFGDVSKLVVLVHERPESSRSHLTEVVKKIVPSSWQVELWDTDYLLSLFRDHFNVEMDAFSSESSDEMRTAIERGKGRFAFGEDYADDHLDASLLWQFGFWRLRNLYDKAGCNKKRILAPGNYKNSIVLFADLSGFTGYLHDTPRAQTVQNCLSAFCTKGRHQIINHGGMMCEYLGDAILGLFGIPDHPHDYVERSFDCARSLVALGESVTNEWQRQIDRIQPVKGCHVGMAMGDIQILSLRPFSSTHIGAVGDTINLAARLSTHAESGQVVASNAIHRNLGLQSQELFLADENIDAKNVGTIKAWTWDDATLRERRLAATEG